MALQMGNSGFLTPISGVITRLITTGKKKLVSVRCSAGDFYKHTAPEQGSQFGATALMQMLLGVILVYSLEV